MYSKVYYPPKTSTHFNHIYQVLTYDKKMKNVLKSNVMDAKCWNENKTKHVRVSAWNETNQKNIRWRWGDVIMIKNASGHIEWMVASFSVRDVNGKPNENLKNRKIFWFNDKQKKRKTQKVKFHSNEWTVYARTNVYAILKSDMLSCISICHHIHAASVFCSFFLFSCLF